MPQITVSDVACAIEAFAPLSIQESFDNSGLLIGQPSDPVQGILIALEVTPMVLEEALACRANLIVSHHPLLFEGLKRITGASVTEQVVMKAIKHGIAIYCAHTNLDSAWGGVSHAMAKALGLSEIKVLKPAPNQLVKLVTFAPDQAASQVRSAMFRAGAGNVGQYSECSFNVSGKGSFHASESASPFVGEKGKTHFEPEVRIEVIVPKNMLALCIAEMVRVHPYEEVAYDIYPLENFNPRVGLGVVGTFTEPLPEKEFLHFVKSTFSSACLRHSALTHRQVQRVALCGGSGAGFLGDALKQLADAFLTADIKYHNFFAPEGRVLLVDIGHYEGEQFAISIFYELLTKKIPNFAIQKSRLNSNPINYL